MIYLWYLVSLNGSISFATYLPWVSMAHRLVGRGSRVSPNELIMIKGFQRGGQRGGRVARPCYIYVLYLGLINVIPLPVQVRGKSDDSLHIRPKKN